MSHATPRALALALDTVIRDELSGYPLKEGAIEAVAARVIHAVSQHHRLHTDSAAAKLRAAIQATLHDATMYPQLSLHKGHRQRLQSALREGRS